VTGGSSGIGRAIAIALAGEGAEVFAVGRRAQGLREAAALAGEAGQIFPHRADLTDDAEIAAIGQRINERGGGVDVLVHAGGTFGMGTLASTPVEELDRQYAVNVRAPYLLTQKLLPAVQAARGQIVFINSSVVGAARAEVAAYAATKHALKGLADALRDALSTEEVRIVSVYPGRTATPMQAKIYALEGRAYVPERLVQPEDIATVVVDVVSVRGGAEVTDVHVRPTVRP
jgi:NAD(P)-dependent dehydrogenase (short-subunit alcohol dehydrogenase family)